MEDNQIEPGMRITLYDTKSRGLMPLDIASGEDIGIYACGPTVYDRIHVGNARPFVVYSLLKAFIVAERARLGVPGKVVLVANITDVNDKIYAVAKKLGRNSADLAEEMTKLYVSDTDGLGLGRPDLEPKATDTIDGIVELITELVKSGNAYPTDAGDVYFSVARDPAYGSLSGRPVEQYEQGEDDQSAKQDKADFALWKATKTGEDTAWESPWGRGRPGWHIECSAMAQKSLGLNIAIHGGGLDLVFPHHENEAAQTRAATGKELAKIWMHNGMLNLGGEKMAKSVGNVAPLHTAIKDVGRDALILLFVSTHYRQPMIYSADTIAQAQAGVRRIRDTVVRIRAEESAQETSDLLRSYVDGFWMGLAHDFDTALALKHMWLWIREANRMLDSSRVPLLSELETMTELLGLRTLTSEVPSEIPSHVLEQVHQRREARIRGDWATADRIRQELSDSGYSIRDGRDTDSVQSTS